jgi:hypothetical protein
MAGVPEFCIPEIIRNFNQIYLFKSIVFFAVFSGHQQQQYFYLI